MPEDRASQTIAAANGIATDRSFGAVAPPLYLSSTFAFVGFEQRRDYDYTRTANPSRAMLADTVARLEGGAGGVVVSSGMGRSIWSCRDCGPMI
jgi:cystathionine gamma-synthase